MAALLLPPYITEDRKEHFLGDFVSKVVSSRTGNGEAKGRRVYTRRAVTWLHSPASRSAVGDGVSRLTDSKTAVLEKE